MTQIISNIGQVKGLRNIMSISASAALALLATTSVEGALVPPVVSGDANFGAKVLNERSETVSATTYQATFKVRADGSVLGQPLQLASGEASLSAQSALPCRASGTLKVGGVTLATWNNLFSASGTFSTAPFIKTLPGGSKTKAVSLFPLLPGFPSIVGSVPLVLTSTVPVKVSVTGTVQVAVNSTTHRPKVQASLIQEIDAAAIVSATAGGHSVPLLGNPVRLTNARLAGTANIAPVGLVGFFPAGASAIATTKGTDGTIRLSSPLIPPLFEYHGGTTSFVF